MPDSRLIILFAVFVCSLGFVAGGWSEWVRHRSYCDCEDCSKWRAFVAEQGIKRKPEGK